MEINAHNYKEVLLQWLEGDLSPTEVLQAEAFILVNEAAAREWQLLQKTKMQPAAQVFFPKKHLLMKEEEEVVVAPVSAAKVVEEEAVVKTLSGGFSYRKFALPLSIAASLLLFFFFFNNRNTVVEKENGAIAEVENIQSSGKGSEGNQPELAVVNPGKTENAAGNEIVKTDNNHIEKQFVSATQITGKKVRNKAFSGKSIYVKNTAENTLATKEELNLVQVEIPVIVVDTETNKTIKPKRSLVKQSQELEKWQEALDKQNQELAMDPDEEMERGTIGKLTHFFTKNVQIKKRTENDVNYYAFRLETENIKIVKTFKSTF
ncbi:MAG: hypothetical protein ACXWDO_04705 [Bacteroidia bacterium]